MLKQTTMLYPYENNETITIASTDAYMRLMFIVVFFLEKCEKIWKNWPFFPDGYGQIVEIPHG